MGDSSMKNLHHSLTSCSSTRLCTVGPLWRKSDVEPWHITRGWFPRLSLVTSTLPQKRPLGEEDFLWCPILPHQCCRQRPNLAYYSGNKMNWTSLQDTKQSLQDTRQCTNGTTQHVLSSREAKKCLRNRSTASDWFLAFRRLNVSDPSDFCRTPS